MVASFRIIDISQPVSAATACFPGDVPFSQTTTLTCESSHVCNLTAITMSPHVGTHADAPAHVIGTLDDKEQLIGGIALDPFVGPAIVVDLSPMTTGGITAELLAPALERLETYRCSLSKELNREVPRPKRILLKTQSVSQPELFKADYPFPSISGVDYLAAQGFTLIGIDTPSVDHVGAKDLQSHKSLISHKISWLENLDLTPASEGFYFLVAAPVKFIDTEAAPVRALLLAGSDLL